jgi:Ni/Fe-hydrogenase subunit HybB-like protein
MHHIDLHMWLSYLLPALNINVHSSNELDEFFLDSSTHTARIYLVKNKVGLGLGVAAISRPRQRLQDQDQLCASLGTSLQCVLNYLKKFIHLLKWMYLTVNPMTFLILSVIKIKFLASWIICIFCVYICSRR